MCARVETTPKYLSFEQTYCDKMVMLMVCPCLKFLHPDWPPSWSLINSVFTTGNTFVLYTEYPSSHLHLVATYMQPPCLPVTLYPFWFIFMFKNHFSLFKFLCVCVCSACDLKRALSFGPLCDWVWLFCFKRWGWIGNKYILAGTVVLMHFHRTVLSSLSL